MRRRAVVRSLLPLTFAATATTAVGVAAVAHADTGTIVDTTAAGPVADGVIGSGEYAGGTLGIGAGFGGMIGDGITLSIDSADTGALGFALVEPGTDCALAAPNTVVIYLDTAAGGFTTTAGFTDNGDPGRIAASGFDGSNRSTLEFGGLSPDFALVFNDGGASLYALVDGGSHVFVVNPTVAASSAGPCIRELGGLTLGDLGLAPGDSFHYVATLLNASNAYRSNELQGTATAPASNIGQSLYTLGVTDVSTFTSYAPPPIDAGVPDAMPVDAGVPDAMPVDASTIDASTIDAST
ncbi:MAG: hypothetical protein H6709_25205, partial [Kofleriaceae bacterium]|nr:hypothetical protein [Kofleriaceae bacterium]